VPHRWPADSSVGWAADKGTADGRIIGVVRTAGSDAEGQDPDHDDAKQSVHSKPSFALCAGRLQEE
jgi:hypothetical protein